MNKIKCIVLVLVAAVALFWGLGGGHSTEISGQTRSFSANSVGTAVPDADLIDRFDRALQQRFLKEPFFGMARIAPRPPQPHRIEHGSSITPVNDEETQILSELAKGEWNVGVYLYGKRALPREDRKDPLEKFSIHYRINRPVAVSHGLEEDDLPGSKKLVKEIKEAFLKFQSGSAETTDVRFTKGEWTFVARPVRAVNQSCVTCHADYVVTAKLPDGKYQFRKRKIGDVNGVIVYGFSKKDAK